MLFRIILGGISKNVTCIANLILCMYNLSCSRYTCLPLWYTLSYHFCDYFICSVQLSAGNELKIAFFMAMMDRNFRCIHPMNILILFSFVKLSPKLNNKWFFQHVLILRKRNGFWSGLWSWVESEVAVSSYFHKIESWVILG